MATSNSSSTQQQTYTVIKGKANDHSKLYNHIQITDKDLYRVNNYFEIVKYDKMQRVFADIDGSISDISETDFYTLVDKIQDVLLNYDPIVGVRNSSKYQANKYQYNKETKNNEVIETVNKISFVILYNKMTAEVSTMKEWIFNNELPILQTLFQGIIPLTASAEPNSINIDPRVYPKETSATKSWKMRCVNAYKDEEDKGRIYKMVKGNIAENTIQNIEGCELIDTIIPTPKVVNKPVKKEVVATTETTITPTTNCSNVSDILIELCDKIPHNYWYDYNTWIVINWIWKNEGLDYKVLDHFSKKYGGNKYNPENNKRIWERQEKQAGYRQSKLWDWLKNSDKKSFDDLQSKRRDFYLMLENNVNNLDLAILYFNIQPHKYAYSKVSKWWEYRPSGILVNTGDEKPTSLINNIGYTLREYFNEQRQLLNPEDKDFKERNESIMKTYAKLGQSSFGKGIIDYLPDLYYNETIDDLVDSNTNIIAFNNMLYDIQKNEYRSIKPDDYISRTTGYDLPDTKSDPIVRAELLNIIQGIFPDEDTRNYYLKITALAFFTNRFESFYVFTGRGRNGKSLLDSLTKKALGRYHYTAESSFLTTVIRAGVPNPNLSECNGVRILSVSEPDNGAENCSLNVELVKSLTGRDKITARGLYEKNKTFDNRFSVFLLCNNKPTLNKIDRAIVERLKCVPFTERFLSNPDLTDEHQHACNDKLKDLLLEPKYVWEYMRYMFEIAYANKDIKGSELKPSELSKETTNEYVEENNLFKFWFETHYKKIVVPSKDIWDKLSKDEKEKYKVKVKTSTVLTQFNEGKPKNEQITAKKLRNALSFNDIEVNISGGYSVIQGYEYTPPQTTTEQVKCLLDELDN